ncbi:SDR family oxidoreductase [Prosthecobacter dejongeii]|uniref:NAD(P)-dependent dehydrogenase (Short-subunit alcohol dehydrogenase family) n=1 Tax=Prosthecobacter dejongeii TaxID=48465 RepID=A0A7W7YHI6_9BACT|nr:SDR family oxidoreductase [Prosthecobacter dejongeii]MBB5036308.1 NAD(P)-dependent dehydrogenase (short-subunit alcohol dehydrogenase family) [Prosthecobacter dejongeii]
MNSQKLVFITGCSRGLGRAMIQEFSARGWTVVGCARDAEKVAQLQQQFPAPHHFMACDVADDAEVRAFCQSVLDQQGVPDLVLNNAAIVNANAPLWEISSEEFSRVVDINVKGTASVMRYLLPAMLKRGSGVVVNFSSGWGRSTSPEVAPYCATKYAIEGLSQAVAQETGGKVAVIPLNPGIIDTHMLRSCFGESADGYPTPEEWARTAVPFLIQLGSEDNGRPLTAPGG